MYLLKKNQKNEEIEISEKNNQLVPQNQGEEQLFKVLIFVFLIKMNSFLKNNRKMKEAAIDGNKRLLQHQRMTHLTNKNHNYH